MRIMILAISLLMQSYSFGVTNVTVFSTLTNSTGIPTPPTMALLPSLEIVSSILNPSNTIEDINEQFIDDEEYTGSEALYVPESMQGVWWRFYTQSTSLFNIIALSEEILSFDNDGTALWLQDVKTTSTVHSRSQRKLQVSYFDLFNHMFFVFHYRNQDPTSQKIRDKQGFFIRILSDQSYMQMSTSPNFEPERSMYWRRFPKYNKKENLTNAIVTNAIITNVVTVTNTITE